MQRKVKRDWRRVVVRLSVIMLMAAGLAIAAGTHLVAEEQQEGAVPPWDFETQMKYFSDHGYTSISPDELYAALAGAGKLPDNPVLITFDDGYRDNYDNAFPILKKYKLKATIFVITSFLGKKEQYLTWEQAREMEKHGILEGFS